MAQYTQIISSMLIVILARGAICAPLAGRSWADDTIVFSKNDVGRPDGYEFGYETAFGNKRYEVGRLREYAEGDKKMEVTGEYQYLKADGTPYTVRYVVNQEGYKELVIPNSKIKSLKKQLEEHKTLSSKLPSKKKIAEQDLLSRIFPLNVINLPKSGDTDGSTSTAKYDISDSNPTVSLDYEDDDEYIGNRVGLPAIVVGSLLG